MSRFAELLDVYRHRQGLSVRALATEAGRSTSYVSLLLRGRNSPSLKVVTALADALQLTEPQRTEFLRAANPSFVVGNSQSAADTQTLTEPADAGIIGVYDKLTDELRIAAIEGAQRTICIMDTWIVDPYTFREAFKQASDKGVVIRILLLQPRSLGAQMRAASLGYSDTDFVSENIDINLREFRQWQADGINVTVRLYEESSVMLYIFDDRIFLSFYLHEKRGNVIQQLEITSDSNFGKRLMSEFEIVWKDAKEEIPQS